MVVEKWTENVPHRGGFCGKHSRQEGSDCYLTGSIPYPGAGNFNPSGCKPDLAQRKPYLVEKKVYPTGVRIHLSLKSVFIAILKQVNYG